MDLAFVFTRPLVNQTLHLEQNALGLLLVELDVLYDEHPDQRESHHSSTANDHVLLSKRVRLLDRKTSLGALGVAELQVQIFVNALPVRKSLGGQEALQSTRKRALPDRATDGASHGSTNVAEHAEESERASCVLVIRCCEDSDLLYDDHSTAGESEEDLAHDEVTNSLVGLAEVDHEALAEHVERYRNPNDPAVALRPLDGEADDEEPDARDDIED